MSSIIGTRGVSGVKEDVRRFINNNAHTSVVAGDDGFKNLVDTNSSATNHVIKKILKSNYRDLVNEY
jgi:hypothetical protein